MAATNLVKYSVQSTLPGGQLQCVMQKWCALENGPELCMRENAVFFSLQYTVTTVWRADYVCLDYMLHCQAVIEQQYNYWKKEHAI